MKKVALAAILAVGFVAQAQADTLIHCVTKNGKQMSVTENGNYLTYRFGRSLSSPEISLTRHVNDVDRFYNVSGGYGFGDFTFRSGAYEYKPYFYENGPSGGVEVYKNGRKLTNVVCRSINLG